MGEPDTLHTDGVELRACKKCKAPLAFVTGPNGKAIPLDLRAPVYTIGKDLQGRAVAQPAPGAHVSHFSSCSHPDFFSSKGRRK